MLSEPTRLRVISTDPGIDDALALVFLRHFAPESMDCLVATGGNVSAGTAGNNCVLLKERFGLVSQVFVGSDPPDFDGDARQVHGSHGLGEVEAPSVCLPAFERLVHHLCAAGAEIDLLVLGPATDAAALLLHEECGPLVRSVVMMGGAFREREGWRGNVTRYAEFNAFADPAALQALLQSPCDCRLVPLDVTQAQPFTAEQLLEGLSGGESAELVEHLVWHLQNAPGGPGAGKGLYPHDVIAAAAWLGLLEPEWRAVHLDQVVSKDTKRGLIVEGSAGPEFRYAAAVDHEQFLRLWEEVAKAL
ncbi:MAG: nucleoside hydrolase [Planctomycetota bacterium]